MLRIKGNKVFLKISDSLELKKIEFLRNDKKIYL